MAECFVAKASELADGDRRIVLAGTTEVGVFCKDGAYFGYSNVCVHSGGPASTIRRSPSASSDALATKHSAIVCSLAAARKPVPGKALVIHNPKLGAGLPGI